MFAKPAIEAMEVTSGTDASAAVELAGVRDSEPRRRYHTK